jgi:phosphate transport system protein
MELAERIIRDDREIDMLENRIDGMLLAILALQQPFAIDLRFITSAMKINIDLERIADKAVAIAKAMRHINANGMVRKQIDKIVEMADYSQEMIRRAFDCFIDRDAATAEQVIAEDKGLDVMNKEAYRNIIEFLTEHRENADLGLSLYRIATSIERIGDLAKSISEEAIYYMRGEIVRHRKKEKPAAE